MKKHILFGLLILSLLIAGCKSEIREYEGTPPAPPGFRTGLTSEEAVAIAQNSACTQEGSLTDNIFYNENTKTWWIELDLEKPGCSPACVVNEETETAEINWRCTGLIAD